MTQQQPPKENETAQALRLQIEQRDKIRQIQQDNI